MAIGSLPPANVPFFNSKTGLILTEWYQALRKILQYTGTGFVVATGSSGQAVTRVMTAGPGIDITNGNGVAGNPTFTALGPDGFGFFIGGLMTDGELLGSGVFDKDITFPSTANTPVVKSEFPATASAVLNLKSISGGVETQRGTITFAAGATDAAVAWTGSTYILPAGDRLRLYGPAVHDTTLSMITGLIPGDLS
jgi:hypothetical protein